MKPIYSVMISGMDVTFTDKWTDYSQRIYQFDFGDGTLYRWDNPDQTSYTHTYRKPGTYQTSAITRGGERSDIVPVFIYGTPQDPEPEPEPEPVKSWWVRFIEWLKKLLGV